VRAAVNVDHHRVFLARLVYVRLHQPAFDFEIADALVRETLGIAPDHIRVHVGIKIGELAFA